MTLSHKKAELFDTMLKTTDRRKYNAMAKRLIDLHYKIHSKRCVLCNGVFWAHTSEQTCIECRGKGFNIDDVQTSILLSDKNFIYENCNGDCFNCQKEDCIL